MYISLLGACANQKDSGKVDVVTDYLAYWDFLGTDTQSIEDKSVNGNNLMAGIRPLRIIGIDGIENSAYNFNGYANKYLYRDIMGTLEYSKEWSLSFWAKSEDSTLKTFFSLNMSPNHMDLYPGWTPPLLLAQATNSDFRFYVSGVYSPVFSLEFINDWNFFTIKNINGNMYFYLNAVMIHSEAVVYSVSTHIYLGVGYNPCTSASMDNVRVYNRILTDVEISLIYNYEKP